jgi:hypothetical protein
MNRLTWKDGASMLSSLLLAATIIWKGGAVVENATATFDTVKRIEQRMDAVDKQQAQLDKQQAATNSDVRVLQERQANHGEKLQNHDARIYRLERSRPFRLLQGERDG